MRKSISNPVNNAKVGGMISNVLTELRIPVKVICRER